MESGHVQASAIRPQRSAVAVLIIACLCALGWATPMSVILNPVFGLLLNHRGGGDELQLGVGDRQRAAAMEGSSEGRTGNLRVGGIARVMHRSRIQFELLSAGPPETIVQRAHDGLPRPHRQHAEVLLARALDLEIRRQLLGALERRIRRNGVPPCRWRRRRP